MFERFTAPARDVAVHAQEEARALRHEWIGTEHLLLGVMTGVSAAWSALADEGASAESTRAEIERVVRDPPLGNQDALALRALGIDLDAVRTKVEETFGVGALERAQHCDHKGRRRVRALVGHIPFTPRAKKALELALREALDLGHDWIGPEHILLGLLRDDRVLAVKILAQQNISAAALRRRVLTALGAAA